MKRTTKGGVALTALGTVAAVSLSACGGGGGGNSAQGGGQGTQPAQKGGTLTVLNFGPREHLDPQRMYIGAEMLEASRLYSRTLLTYAPGNEDKVVPDLATDTGKKSNGGKTWQFTLKDGVKWQDGKDVTCADLKYGASRTFAQDVITGGPNYILGFLNVPTKKTADGEVPTYDGPYKKEGQADFDKAITCSGKTITYNFKKPWNDFDQNLASLQAFAPFRADKDKGAQSDFAGFSNGPYMLQGTFDPNKGGTFVRNPNWDQKTDDIRKAYPDTIKDVEGVKIETIYQRLISDGSEDKAAVSGIQAGATSLPQIANNPNASGRSANVPAPYVDYLAPNLKSKTMSNPKVRQAFAMATNRNAYITANGGSSVMDPTFAMCNKTLKCYKDFNAYGNPANGDPNAAKQLLQQAGVQVPLPITVVYRKRDFMDKAFDSLKQSWDQAGFQVTLQGISDKYYATIQSPGMASKDVFWAGWGADWPSGSTVMPALFDGRVNISAGGSGQDYGYYNDAQFNQKVDQTYAITDDAQREKAWGELDEYVAKQGASVPLVNQKFTFMYGSSVRGFKTNAQMGSYPDLAEMGAK